MAKALEYGKPISSLFKQTINILDIPFHRCRTGLNHLAFHGQSREQIDDITKKLKQKGVHILYPDQHPFAGGKGHYAVFFEDPDRIKVELVAP